MSYLPVSLKEIMNSGGNLIIGDGYLPVTLKELAAIAKAKNLKLTIKSKTLLPATMKEIAAIGGGHVIFDIS
jgi:hypothetical protein